MAREAARSARPRTRRAGLAVLVALAVVLSAAAVATPAAATELTITDTTLPDSVTQGNDFDLTVSVTGQELESNEVDVSLTVPDGLSCSPAGTQTVTLSDGSGQATFQCDANVEGDYAGEITVSASGASSGDDADPSRTTQTGLEVLSPASLSLTTSLDASSVDEGQTTTLTAVVNNLGDASTSYSLSLSSASGYSSSVTAGSASGTVRGGQVQTVEFTVTGDAAGDYTLTASLSGGNGQTLSADEALTVQATGGGGGGGGASTDDGSTSDDGTTDELQGTADATVEAVGDAVTATVAEATAESTVAVDLRDTSVATTTGGVGLQRLDVSFAEEGSFEGRIAEGREVGVPELAADTGDRSGDDGRADDGDGDDGRAADGDADAALKYVSVDHTTPDRAIGGVTFTFAVEQTTLDRRGLSAAEVSVYRYHDDAWTELDTRVDARTNGTVSLVAESPGLSTFAVAPSGDAAASPTPEPTETPASTPAESTETHEPTTTAEPTATTARATTSTSMPGFTPLLAGLSLLAAALLAARRATS